MARKPSSKSSGGSDPVSRAVQQMKRTQANAAYIVGTPPIKGNKSAPMQRKKGK